MALVNPARRLTEEEYLQMERAAEFKSEFFAGQILPMSPCTRWHSSITVNLLVELGEAVKGTGCLVFESNLRVKVEATGLYTYPDATVACEEQRFADGEMDTLLNPSLVAEVLSDSTEAYDRGKKFENYRQLPSLREYLLVSQREPRLEIFTRRSVGEWVLSEASGMEATLQIPSSHIAISLAQVFANVRFDPQPLPPSPPRKS